ncbi:MAG: nitroreductase family deazaflavin-dependent oxidoreductase [Candidatus Promineifilaceae bacterium]|nr:nitroreductase family deazaflavin-dependent oxidoreductase [Candidatus Promineifilaceae bacterium]
MGKAERSTTMKGYPTTASLRWLYRSPIVLWRLGLGPIVGQILLLLTHTGRKSGRPRRTLIEYHSLDGHYYAPCAFGPRSDWYQNIVADPRVTIQTAAGTRSAHAQRVTTDRELLSVYRLFKRRNPLLLSWYLGSLDIPEDEAAILANKAHIYWIRFDPSKAITPPPLPADRIWFWPALGALLLAVRFLRRRFPRAR